MLASGIVRPEVSTEGLSQFLTHGFVLQPDTMISGVRMLEPGTLERCAGRADVRKRFWTLPPYIRAPRIAGRRGRPAAARCSTKA